MVESVVNVLMSAVLNVAISHHASRIKHDRIRDLLKLLINVLLKLGTKVSSSRLLVLLYDDETNLF
jgi:hypothetical protein